MTTLHRTIFFQQHKKMGAKIVEFGGWEMPIQYPDGILAEHITTREKTGLFDVSHMGRLLLKGRDTTAFLQHVLTNNIQALAVGESQYTLIQNETGGAIDDAYLYRFVEDEYLLVVNASNREKDLAHLGKVIKRFPDVQMIDKTFDLAMVSLQGPLSKTIMGQVINKGHFPDPARNCLSIVQINASEVLLARTGYTGEPLCFELFIKNEHACKIWDLLIEKGAAPIGLGARDTLRLEACLPLYGHELGIDHTGNEIPLFASKLSKFAVSFSKLKGDFIGKDALEKQHAAFKRIMHQDFSDISALPKMVMPLAITGKGIAREGHKVFYEGKQVGYITSGTSVPYKPSYGSGLDGTFEETASRRSIALALIDSTIKEGDILEVEIRKKHCEATVVPYHISSQAPPYVRPIPHNQIKKTRKSRINGANIKSRAARLLSKATRNNNWRQKECINLIPSEMSQSLFTRMLSIADPVNRYAEHKEIQAFSSEDVFYYQGTEFIEEVEALLGKEFQTYFDCRNIESRVVSGQMANTAVFSGIVDFLNSA